MEVPVETLSKVLVERSALCRHRNTPGLTDRWGKVSDAARRDYRTCSWIARFGARDPRVTVLRPPTGHMLCG
jgi:hypothetical protein